MAKTIGRTVHVFAEGDISEHHTEREPTCYCQPSVDPVLCDDGSWGYVVVHNNLKREIENAGGKV